MSKIREAIERKYPRYMTTDYGEVNVCLSYATQQGDHVAFISSDVDADTLVKERNELIDKLIEATELLNEASPQTQFELGGNTDA